MSVYQRETLANGVRLLAAPMPQVQSVACLIMLAAGSRYETPETSGIAHFAEQMFFTGTENGPSAQVIGNELEGIGAGRSTSSSTCSATRSSTPRRSSARRA